jgi:hypothetical protein
MKKLVIVFLSTLLIIFPSLTNAEIVTASPIQVEKDSTNLQLQDMLMLMLLPQIREDVVKYYKPILTVTPDMVPWKIVVVETKRENGFRGFILSITLDVEPTVGQYVPVGKERIKYLISYGPSVKLVKYTHLKTYNLPSELQNTLR